MKKKKVFRYAAFCFTLLFLMVPDVSAEWGDTKYRHIKEKGRAKMALPS